VADFVDESGGALLWRRDDNSGEEHGLYEVIEMCNRICSYLEPLNYADVEEI